MIPFENMPEASPQLQTSVVLLIFNRPDKTRRVFEVIRRVRPVQLFVIADGPRAHRIGEDMLCHQARSVLEQVDWPCQVLTNFADDNLGCRRRIVSGLDWVFSQVEEAIILEDDCLPDATFFRFCSELLERYRDDPRIGQIGGINLQPAGSGGEHSYYFSRYNHIWGWASWRRAWYPNDDTMGGWPAFRDSGGLKRNVTSPAERRYWINAFDRVASGELDTWDCQWTLACWQHNLLTVLPRVNLVSNIGFGSSATHTTEASQFADIPSVPMLFPLYHPGKISINESADAYTARIMFRPLTLMRKLAIFLFGRG
jgi:hypothetical protein